MKRKGLLIVLMILICIISVGCTTIVSQSTKMVDGKILIFTSNGLEYDFSFIGSGGRVHSTENIELNSKITIDNTLPDNVVKISYEVTEVVVRNLDIHGNVLSSNTGKDDGNIYSDTPIKLIMNEKTFKYGMKKEDVK